MLVRRLRLGTLRLPGRNETASYATVNVNCAAGGNGELTSSIGNIGENVAQRPKASCSEKRVSQIAGKVCTR